MKKVFQNRVFKHLLPLSIIGIFGCCQADCVAVPIQNCVSSKELNPVCGCDKKTYGNPSEAKCASIDTYTIGACK